MADLGTSISNDGDFTSQRRVVSGRESLIQALVRRLTTSRGALWYDDEFGTNLCDFINQAIRHAWVVEQATEEECLKDERVEACTASAELLGSKVTLTLAIEAVDGDEFELVLDVSAVTVEVLEIREAA